jgi:uridylate kinase
MAQKRRLLIKVSGELLDFSTNTSFPLLTSLLQQIQALQSSYHFGLVIGGGNIIRGASLQQQYAIEPTRAHLCGILATMINSQILVDACAKIGLPAKVLCGIDCPVIGQPVSVAAIEQAFAENALIIFAAGIGTPYFSTDAASVIRALEMKADGLWKLTKVDGIYDTDPYKNSDARFIAEISFDEAIKQKLGVIDLEALYLAAKNHLSIRVLSMYADKVLQNATQDLSLGSRLINKDR